MPRIYRQDEPDEASHFYCHAGALHQGVSCFLIYIYIYIYMYIHIYVCPHIYIYIYIHTLPPPSRCGSYAILAGQMCLQLPAPNKPLPGEGLLETRHDSSLGGEPLFGCLKWETGGHLTQGVARQRPVLTSDRRLRAFAAGCKTWRSRGAETLLRSGFHWLKIFFICPCWFERDSITGNMFVFSRGLKQMEVGFPIFPQPSPFGPFECGVVEHGVNLKVNFLEMW